MSDVARAGRAPRPVVVVGPLPPPVTGAAVVTDRMRETLASAGADVRVVDTNHNVAGVRRLARLLGGLLLVLRLAGRRPGVYVGGAGGGLLWYQAIVVLVARLVRAGTVFHHHSYGQIARPSAAMRAVTLAGGRRLEHVVLAAGMRSDLQRHYPAARRVTVCSNAGTMAAGGAVPGPDERPRSSYPVVLGHLSNLTLEKGLAEVLEVTRAAVAAGIDAGLLLGGPAANPEAEALLAAARTELGDRITWLGPVPADEVEDFYRRIDLFLFPSRYALEAEPLVVLEAARAGVPTVAYGVGNVAEVVDPPGIVVPPEQDLVPVALDLVARVAGRSDPDPTAVRERFLARRDEAAAAWQGVAERLVRG